MAKCKVQPKKNETFNVQFNELTSYEVNALINALRIARTCSPVADDLSSYLRNGFCNMQSELDQSQSFMDLINADIGLKVVQDEKDESVERVKLINNLFK